ncbi:hypothetical protein FQA39_LY05418 [Lamprigera yunnana]|nr:hypothetical protein FQA39_LY05418 [Lamprigera yunnana]
MVLKLYTLDYSPPSRAVLLTAEALNIELEEITVNLKKLENFKAEFVQINPQHTIPTLNDDGFIVWDSHAINAYLVRKYGENDFLYSEESHQRAIIDQRLHFDSCNMFGLLRVVARPIIYRGSKTISQYLIEEVNESYEILNNFLKNSKWVAGDRLSIADFSLISTVTSIDVLIPIDLNKYTNIDSWLKRARSLPYYHINQKGVDDFKEYMNELLNK